MTYNGGSAPKFILIDKKGNHKMYDIKICVLASSKKIKRLIQFLEIGLNYSNKYKIKIVYLADESEEKPDFIKDEWVKLKGPISCRFISYILQNKNESRWVFQVDDDSCTDVDRTLDIVDYFYDDKDPVIIHGSSFYVVNGRSHGTFYMDENLQKIAKDLDIKNLFLGTDNLNEFELMPRFKHSWEHTLASQGAIEKFKNKREEINNLLNLCSKYSIDDAITGKQGIADQIPYVAAKLAKIPIDENFIFCPFPIGSDYTAINENGRYTHIHHVLELWDQLDNFKKIIKNKIIFKDRKSAELALKKSSIEETFWYLRFMNQTAVVKFEKNGVIGLFKNEKISKWKEKNNSILLIDKNEETIFDLNKIDKENYKGLYLNEEIYLNKIDIMSLIGNPEIKKLYE